MSSSPQVADDPLTEHFDVVIVGAGVAGITAALSLAREGAAKVALVTKGSLGDSTTRFAQGGIAVATSSDDDTKLHLSDTIAAGAGLCDEEATEVLVEEGPHTLERLIESGAIFDRSASGELLLSKEGGHSLARVVHAGGSATGAEVSRSLVACLLGSEVKVFDHTFTSQILRSATRCLGVSAIAPDGSHRRFGAANVVLASGGVGQLFEGTTNPVETTGDGIAMAIRAGVVVADLEFVQFHPTALRVASWPLPLLSEAVRGEGAVLRNSSSERFVDELAPRDVVSAAIARELSSAPDAQVYLDVRSIGDFSSHFPNLAAILENFGLDPTHDLLPVIPAAHYLCGGVLCDLDGASTLSGLYAVGEVACSGVEGANRLASNSLLEGLVFGTRAARAIMAHSEGPSATGAMRGWLDGDCEGAIPVRAIRGNEIMAKPDLREVVSASGDAFSWRDQLAREMSTNAGVLRDTEGLSHTRAFIATTKREIVKTSLSNREREELENLLTVGAALVDAALTREESRGAHRRSDFPDRDDRHFQARLAIVNEAVTHA